MNLRDGHAHVDANRERRKARQNASQSAAIPPRNSVNAETIPEPCRHAQASDKLSMMMELPTENFVIPVNNHDDSEHNPQDEEP